MSNFITSGDKNPTKPYTTHREVLLEPQVFACLTLPSSPTSGLEGTCCGSWVVVGDCTGCQVCFPPHPRSAQQVVLLLAKRQQPGVTYLAPRTIKLVKARSLRVKPGMLLWEAGSLRSCATDAVCCSGSPIRGLLRGISAGNAVWARHISAQALQPSDTYVHSVILC